MNHKFSQAVAILSAARKSSLGAADVCREFFSRINQMDREAARGCSDEQLCNWYRNRGLLSSDFINKPKNAAAWIRAARLLIETL